MLAMSAGCRSACPLRCLVPRPTRTLQTDKLGSAVVSVTPAGPEPAVSPHRAGPGARVRRHGPGRRRAGRFVQLRKDSERYPGRPSRSDSVKVCRTGTAEPGRTWCFRTERTGPSDGGLARISPPGPCPRPSHSRTPSRQAFVFRLGFSVPGHFISDYHQSHRAHVSLLRPFWRKATRSPRLRVVWRPPAPRRRPDAFPRGPLSESRATTRAPSCPACRLVSQLLKLGYGAGNARAASARLRRSWR